jgi:5,6-dimethylbenzimidazole synthase
VDVGGFYHVVHRRRDVRGEFTGDPVPPEVLRRILDAAHAAPSVGLSQPWDFVLVRNVGTRSAFREHVQRERAIFAQQLEDQRATIFSRIKVEGVLESSLGIVVTYDSERGSPAVLGRHAIADTGLYSVCLAIENLWLAATAEGLGVGWVSFYREDSCESCWTSHPGCARWPGYAWAPSRTCTPPPTWNATAGVTVYRWRRCYMRNDSEGAGSATT